MGVVALLSLSLFVTCVTAAQHDVVEEENEAMKVPVMVIYRAQGFAIKEDVDEFHTVQIHILRVRHVEPVMVRGLLGEDKNIEEIRREIIEKGQAFYRGNIRFVEEHYRLVNVNVTRAGKEKNYNINANVMVPLQGLEPNQNVGSVGNMSVTVTEYEGVWIGEGELSMYGENYRVLLDVLPQFSRNTILQERKK